MSKLKTRVEKLERQAGPKADRGSDLVVDWSDGPIIVRAGETNEEALRRYGVPDGWGGSFIFLPEVCGECEDEG